MAIQELKKWRGHCGAKKKVGGQHKCLSCMVIVAASLSCGDALLNYCFLFDCCMTTWRRIPECSRTLGGIQWRTQKIFMGGFGSGSYGGHLQIRISEKNKFKATTQQFITAKISGCVLKQGSETHSSLRQSNLQLQNQAALMSRRIRAVEHWRCAAGLAGAHPGLQDRILLKRIKYARKCLFF